MNRLTSQARRFRAFSLVELLLVLAVIGIIVTVALPSLLGFRNKAIFAKNERNAQMIANIASAARSAGATNQWMTPDECITDLENTVKVKVGSDVVNFSISPLNAEDRTNASQYLVVDTSLAMVYYTGPTQ